MGTMQKEMDDFENAFYYFIDALRVLEMSAESQCEHMGGYNVPWEIQHDISGVAQPLVSSPASYLTHEQAQKIIQLAEDLSRLPIEAIAPPNTPTTTSEGSMVAMNHTAWVPLRKNAAQLLKLLEPAIQKNREFFEGS